MTAETLRALRLTRDDLEGLINNPNFDQICVDCFVRVLLEGDVERRKYQIAQITGISAAQQPYTFGNLTPTTKLLNLKFAKDNNAIYQINTVSNSAFHTDEIDRFLRGTNLVEEDLQRFQAKREVIAGILHPASPPLRTEAPEGDTVRPVLATRPHAVAAVKMAVDVQLPELNSTSSQLFPWDLEKLSIEELRRLEQQVDEYRLRIRAVIADKLKCVICMDKECIVIFYPCKHKVVCDSCSHKVTRCPMCRMEIKDVIKPFVP
eukprot:TRINITY_DN6602_c0_g1_i1.p1 TRINITY_DN6602_c0_g1~~TRINITY_DN6602_c0_g1_i1.p1  ORF type:complete len:263 (-),score=36.87 TRINITY_DN6602_c0_g1_i1:14-802(-)